MSLVQSQEAFELLALEEMREVIQHEGARARKREVHELPLYLRIRPQSANELGGTRSLQAPQVLSTKTSAPAYSFGGSTSARLKLTAATSPGPIYKVQSTLGTAAVSFGTAEQRPRAANQRRFSHHSTAPGPASYVLPSSIGASHVISRMKSSRASSFGTAPARRELWSRNTVSPGAKYDVRAVTREGKRRPLGATWSSQPRMAVNSGASLAPGPASYSRPSSVGRGNIESTLRNQPAVSFGTASRANSDFTALALRASGNYPGAGSYSHNSMLGPQLLSERRSAQGTRFAQADRFKQLAADETFIEGAGYGARRTRARNCTELARSRATAAWPARHATCARQRYRGALCARI
jgi:hypothetical protein